MPPKRKVSEPEDCSVSKRKHKSLTIMEKVDLLRRLDSGASVKQLCTIFDIGSSTVYDVKKNKLKLLQFFADSVAKKELTKRKNMKEAKSVEVDAALMTWYRLRWCEGLTVSGQMLKEQARIFSDELNPGVECRYSEGWLQKFKVRHGISLHNMCSEKYQTAEDTAAAFIKKFAKLVEDEKLTPNQIYNGDETTLFWRCMLGETLEELSIGKVFKDRMTVLTCSNAAGNHRCKLLCIGEQIKPRAFKGIIILPVIYRANKRGWVTSTIFRDWFENYFVPSARAHCNSVGLAASCKIVLILNNCPVHPEAKLLVKGNIYGMCLPANCTSLIQPQDQGVKRSLKCRYRVEFMKRMLNAVDSGVSVNEFRKQFNIKNCVWELSRAWESVPASTLTNCWLKLWPGLASLPAQVDFIGIPHEKAVINELLEYAQYLNSPEIQKMKCSLRAETLEQWVDVDKDEQVVQQVIDQELIQMMLKMDESRDNKEDDEEEKEEKISIDKCIQLTSELIEGLEQHSFMTEQEIMNVYLIQTKLIREKPKQIKLANLSELFQKIIKKNELLLQRSLANAGPVASTSSSTDPAILHDLDAASATSEDADYADASNSPT